MSSDSLIDALDESVAAGWAALGCQIDVREQASVVDLEALLVATAMVGDELASRTYEAALDWCVAFGDMISTTRLRRIAAEMGGEEAIVRFSSQLLASGGPRLPMAMDGAVPVRLRGRVQVADLTSDARLLWRLRAAFGVSARSDILGLLLTSDHAWSVSEISRRTRYAKRGVAGAIRVMALAGVVEITRESARDVVRLAVDTPLVEWRPAYATRDDAVARWRVAIEAHRAMAATAGARPAVAAVERRASAERMRPLIVDAGLPRLPLTVLGEEFSETFSAYCLEVAAAIAPPRGRPGRSERSERS